MFHGADGRGQVVTPEAFVQTLAAADGPVRARCVERMLHRADRERGCGYTPATTTRRFDLRRDVTSADSASLEKGPTIGLGCRPDVPRDVRGGNTRVTSSTVY